MTQADAEAAAALPWRVTQVERAVDKKADQTEVDDLKDDLKGLRKAVMVAALLFVGGSLLVSLTLLFTVGSHVAGS